MKELAIVFSVVFSTYSTVADFVDVFNTSRLVVIATEEAPVVVTATETSTLDVYVAEVSAITKATDHEC